MKIWVKPVIEELSIQYTADPGKGKHYGVSDNKGHHYGWDNLTPSDINLDSFS